MKFQLCAFQIKQVKLLKNCENDTFPLAPSMTLTKICQIFLQIDYISAALKWHQKHSNMLASCFK